MKRYDRAYFDKWYRSRGRITTGAEVRRKVTLAVSEAEYFLRRSLHSVLDVACGEAAWFPQSPDVTLLSAVPGFLLTGALFVIPAAVFAAATLWLVRSGHVAMTPLTAAFGIVIAALTALLFGAGLGILTGGAVALALERPARRATIGAVLLVVLIVVGNAPFIPALFTPSGPTQ